MPIYDYECKACGHVTEAIAKSNEVEIFCGKCHTGIASRIISASGAYCGNQDTGWIKTVLEVVDKSGQATPADKQFRKDPTRANYKRWMKSRGLRPMEDNEPKKPAPTDLTSLHHKVAVRHMKRNKLEIR
jgi:putative FmdB family regulatory protein